MLWTWLDNNQTNLNVTISQDVSIGRLSSLRKRRPHCYRCNNMNMNLNVVCEECDKIFCKSHSYCVLGDNDMHYCSRECFYKYL